MRIARVYGVGTSYYHCTKRVIDDQFLFGEEEKDFIVTTMRKVEAFTGVQVLAYCVMDNHFHLLVKVKEETLEEASEEELVERMRNMYSKNEFDRFHRQIAYYRANDREAEITKLFDTFRARLFSLDSFMKTLSQRISFWFNKKHKRRGPLWIERYKSVLIEPPTAPPPGQQEPLQVSDSPLTTIAAYVELNPVRAGLVENPKDYHWCSFAEASRHGEEARRGIAEVVTGAGHQGTWRGVSRIYRSWLLDEGSPEAEDVDSGSERKDEERSIQEMLRHRIRYFTHAGVIGSEAFVESSYQRIKESTGLKRKTGAKIMKQADWGWYALHNVRDPVT